MMATIFSTDMSDEMQENIVEGVAHFLDNKGDDHLTNADMRLIRDALASGYGSSWTCIANSTDTKTKKHIALLKGNYIYFILSTYSFIIFNE